MFFTIQQTYDCIYNLSYIGCINNLSHIFVVFIIVFIIEHTYTDLGSGPD